MSRFSQVLFQGEISDEIADEIKFTCHFNSLISIYL